MKILSINRDIRHENLDITYIDASSLAMIDDIGQYSYIIINGGDGTIRRVVKELHADENLPPFILNPTGSFNVVAKLHKVAKVENILASLEDRKSVSTEKQAVFSLNDEIFLFSAGNMGDLQHIFLSETLRFGWLKNGIFKYILSVLFLLPVHLIMTPFMLMSSSRFFIFTPLKFIKKFGSFYSDIDKIDIDLKNEHNMLELDGDVVIINQRHLHIKQRGCIKIVLK